MEIEDVDHCDCDIKQTSNILPAYGDEKFVNWFIKTLSSNYTCAYKQFLQYVTKYGQEIVTKNCNSFTVGFERFNIKGDFFFNCDDMEYSTAHHVTPFLYAVIQNNIDIVQHMIQYNEAKLEIECCLDIESDNCLIHGLCALTIAVSMKYHKMVELLLSFGANVDHPTESLSTALRIACHSNDIEMIRMLISFNANPNFMNIFEHTPLMLSAFLGHEEAVMLLIKHGANVNQGAKCGATALHFASQEGREYVVRLLIKLGAVLKKDDSGHTPLIVAALNCRIEVVHEFLSIPSLTSYEDKITALELLGASFISTFNEHFDIENVYYYLKCAFLLRYSGMNSPDCQNCTCCHIQDNLTEEQKKEIPSNAKKVLDSSSTYEYHIECQTLEQLNSIRYNERKTFLECLVVLERILGPKSLNLADTLKRCGAILADNLEVFKANKLWLRAMRIKIDARIFISMDFFHFTKLIDKMSRYNQQYTNFLKEGLQMAIDYYEARPRPFGYQKLLFPKPIEEFTYNNHKHIHSPVSSKNHGEIVNPQRDSDILIYMLLYLVQLIAKDFKIYSQEDQESFRKLTYLLCRSNITESRTGRTLLHLSLSNDFINEYMNVVNSNHQLKFPYVKLATFLVSCGADVTAMDMLHNTPLHYLARFCVKDKNAKLDDHINLMESIVNCRVSPLHHLQEYSDNISNQRKLLLFYGGEVSTHLDAVNVFGKTPFEMNKHVLTNIVLNHYKKVPNLKCLAARIVHKKYFEKIAFQFTFIDPKSASGSCGNFISFVNSFLPIDSTEQNDVWDRELRPGSYMHNFEQIDDNMNNPEISLKLMLHYSKTLNISLELVQFVEMHGRCKFAHI